MAAEPSKAKQVKLPKRIVAKAKTATQYSRYAKGAQVPDNSVAVNNASSEAIRNSLIGSTQAIRLLARKNGNVGSSIFSFVEIAKSGFTVRAYNTGSNTFNSSATQITKSIMATMDSVYDYTSGYSDVYSIDSLTETLLREAVITSQVGAELVLDKNRLPKRIAPVAAETLKWVSNGDGTVHPVQKGASLDGGDIDLNIPNFWVSHVHRDLTRNYVAPMLEPAINMALYYDEFVDDMRRAVRVTGHSRLVVKLDSEKVLAAAPQEILGDDEKVSEFLEQQRKNVEDVVKDLSPEDAIVTYDSVDIDDVQSKDVKADYTDLLTAVSGMLATSLKSHPSILGLRMEGSQSLSNTESMVFLKIAKGIQRPVEEVMSRALTLAIRLYGIDAYVKFSFKPINLRPEDELESYRTMRQQRVLELLSLGMITDSQAADELGISALPDGYSPLSGTQFFNGSKAVNDMVNAVDVSKDPQGNALTPNTPKKAGGKSQ